MANRSVTGERRLQPLLHTKLTAPPLTPQLTDRRRLTSKLERWRNAPLTLISAPAGFGKTTLACEWLAASGIDYGWVSLDETDNEGGRFWAYVCAAIDRARPGFLDRTAHLPPLLHTPEPEQLLTLILNELSRLEDRFALVLDDFHVIREKRLLRGFAYFAEYLPPSVRLIVISRTEPGFAIARMEARDVAVRLNEGDLRLTAEEGNRLLRGAGLELRDEEAELLLARTEGWMTGLKLAIGALENETDRTSYVRRFAGDARHVRQYLLEEVYSNLSAEMRTFLLRCSLLNRWCLSLCRAVSGFEDAAEKIGELERLRLFVVPLDAYGEWFRLHHLFSEFLRDRAEREAVLLPERYAAAGDWCREKGLKEEAVEYYLLGGCSLQAVEVLEEMTAQVVDWGWANLQKRLSVIPLEVLIEHPVLYFSYANSLVAEDAGDPQQGQALLEAADAWFSRTSDSMSEEERNRFMALSHYVWGTLMVFGRHDLVEARRHYELASRRMPAGVGLIFGFPEKPLQASNVRTYRIGKGHASREIAEPYTLQLAELFRSVNPVFLGKLFLNHAEVLYLWNDLEAAERYAEEARRWIEKDPARPEFDFIPLWSLDARIRAAQGHLQEAFDILEGGRRRIRAMGFPRGADLLEMETARMSLVHRGDPAPLLAWMEGVSLKHGDLVSVYELYDYILYARGLAISGKHGEASLLLERLRTLSERELRPIDGAEILGIHAELLFKQRERRLALLRLEEAAALCEENGFVRILMDEGETVKLLLGELALAKQRGRYRGRNAATLGFVRSILAGMDATAAAGAETDPLSALLTAREMDVYQGLLDNLNGRQIAERLKMGYETVKTHRSRIYSKLGVSNRDEAVRRAAELDGIRPGE
ncbi:LuxR C-terminal-related transcriptional regulator [Cohnella hongkongensis]|uniref:LuxR C-terminal-related transcriptional regulator n=1 Tax=Cohnella hongkongensis TaxID=178337 RepID=A0ABV9FB09_9BACL